MQHHGPFVFGHLNLTIPTRLAHRLGAGSALESWTLVIVTGVVTLLVATAAAWQWRSARRAQRRGRVHLAQAVLATSFLGVVLTGALGINAYVGYVPSVGAALALATGGSAARPATTVTSTSYAGGRILAAAAPRVTTSSSVADLSLPSRRLGMPNGNAYVYLPAGYTPTVRYPVLYLLGGAPGGPSDWLYAGNLRGTADTLMRAHYVRPFIIVMPRISPTWRNDYEVLNSPGGPQVMTYLTHVVVPAIDARYSTVATRAGRAIAGFSAGADGALNLALHNQRMFVAAGAIVPEGWPGRGQWWVVHYNHALMWANSPIRYLPHLHFSAPMAFYLSGAGPKSDGPVAKLASQLRAGGQTVMVHNESGLGHNWNDARTDLPYLLQFTSRVFDTSVPAGA